MRLDESCHIVDCGLPVDSQVRLPQLLCDPRPYHVDPQDLPARAVRKPLGDDLHDAVGVTDDLGPAVADEPV